MARTLYGATAADFTMSTDGRVVPGAAYTVWDAATGGNQISDLLDEQGNALPEVRSDQWGRVVFHAPDGEDRALWVDGGAGEPRVIVRPANATGYVGGFEGPPGQNGADGVGVPAGGTMGQALVKASGNPYDTRWADVGGGPGDGAAHVATHFGIVGDGLTDNAAALQFLLDELGEGATVVFPQGIYRVSTTIRPKRGQTLVGCQAVKYSVADAVSADSYCAIAATADFTGTSLIEVGPSVFVGRISGLNLVGPGIGYGTTVHGINFTDTTVGERSWMVDNCQIQGFSGNGVNGRLWVFHMRDTYISRCKWAVSGAMTDCYFIGNMFHFNRDGGFRAESRAHSGAVHVLGCRVERSGNKPGDPARPENPSAPGIKIERGSGFLIDNTSTDACTGPGLDIGSVAAQTYAYSIVVNGCLFSRDGGGDQVTATTGVYLHDCEHVTFTSNVITYGAHDDNVGTQLSPQYGLHLKDAQYCTISGGRTDVPDAAKRLRLEGSTWRTQISQWSLGQSSSVVQQDSERPAAPMAGGWYFSQTTEKPMWWSGWRWVDASGKPEGGTAGTDLGAYADLAGTAAQQKVIRYLSDGTVRWVSGVNPDSSQASWKLDRHDDAGTYVASPVTVRRTDGLITTSQQFVTTNTAATPAVEARGAAGQTAPIIVGADSAGTQLFRVYPDGRVKATAGSSSDDLVTKAQLDAAGGGGSGGGGPQLDVAGAALQNKNIRFLSDGQVKWTTGVNSDASGGVWSVQRYTAGVYTDTPLMVNSSGKLETSQQFIRANATNAIPLEVRPAASNTVSMFRVADSGGATQLEVTYDGEVRAAWGQYFSTGGYVKLGPTRVVNQGATGTNQILACFTDTAASTSQANSVFEVRANGSVKVGAPLAATDAVQRQQLDEAVMGMTATAATKATVGNLLTANQASVETDTTGLTDTIACTVARSTAQAAVGTASLAATATGTGTIVFGVDASKSAAVTPGTTYTAVALVRSAATARDAQLTLTWRGAGYSGILDEYSSVVVTSTSGWKLLTVTSKAPLEAVYAQVRVAVYGPAAGEVHYADCFGLWQGAGGQWALPGTPITNLGTYTDESVGRRIFTWDTINNRWQMTYGDTGWRDVSAGLKNGYTGTLYLRRIGAETKFTGSITRAAVNGAYDIPTGFRPTQDSIHYPYFACRSGTTGVVTTAMVDAELYIYGVDNNVYPVGGSFVSGDAWPTTLPGTAVGAIPTTVEEPTALDAP